MRQIDVHDLVDEAGFTSFHAVRFLAGRGIGGVMPNIVAQMTEYSLRRIGGTIARRNA
jgi:AAHS family benzoate transporter-like MFS transporter